MPKQRKGARLWLRPARRSKATGKVTARALWIIIDNRQHHPTGCFEGETQLAEQYLAEYIAGKYKPARKERELEAITVADVLNIYVEDCRPKKPEQAKKFDQRIGRLNDFFGSRTLNEINGELCRDYARRRGNHGGSRRDLEDLRSAINHHGDEGFHRSIVKVSLPAKGPARDRWLTRDEAASLLWTCWRHREMQRRHRGADKGHTLATDKYPLRHLARFILIGLYTGTRATAIAKASPIKGEGRSFVDLESGLYYRLPEGDTPTKKRQPPAPLPRRLLAHMRRWYRRGLIKQHFVEWNGKPVASVKTAMASAVRLAGLPGKVTPHTLRHTAATWLMQSGISTWRAAGFLGMSVETLDRVYGHHHPDYLAEAAEAIGRKPTDSRRVTPIEGKPRRQRSA